MYLHGERQKSTTSHISFFLYLFLKIYNQILISVSFFFYNFYHGSTQSTKACLKHTLASKCIYFHPWVFRDNIPSDWVEDGRGTPFDAAVQCYLKNKMKGSIAK